jgi:ankyrin repeat protein
MKNIATLAITLGIITNVVHAGIGESNALVKSHYFTNAQSNAWNTAFDCLSNGDNENFINALEKGGQKLLKERDEGSQTLLHYAAATENIVATYELILRKAPLLSDEDGLYPQDVTMNKEIHNILNSQLLHLPLEVQLMIYNKLFLEDLASLDQTCKQMRNPISVAMKYAPKTKKQQIKLNDNFNNAIDTKAILMTLDRGTNINFQNKEGNTPLYYAVYDGKIETTKFLLSNGANPNIQNEDNIAPLHLAIVFGNIEIIEFLLSNGADPSIQDEDGASILHYAAGYEEYEENVKVIQFLLEKYAYLLNVQDKKGSTPLHYAAISEKAGNIKALVLHDAKNINIQNEKGDTPLHKAAVFGNIEPTEFLLSNGADPNIKNKKGDTPLHKAAMFGNIEPTEFLLSNGADPNIKNIKGNTPLHKSVSMIVEKGEIKILLSNGADPNIKNNNGDTTLDLVRQKFAPSKRISKLIQILEQAQRQQ